MCNSSMSDMNIFKVHVFNDKELIENRKFAVKRNSSYEVFRGKIRVVFPKLYELKHQLFYKEGNNLFTIASEEEYEILIYTLARKKEQCHLILRLENCEKVSQTDPDFLNAALKKLTDMNEDFVINLDENSFRENRTSVMKNLKIKLRFKPEYFLTSPTEKNRQQSLETSSWKPDETSSWKPDETVNDKRRQRMSTPKFENSFNDISALASKKAETPFGSELSFDSKSRSSFKNNFNHGRKHYNYGRNSFHNR